MYYASDDSIITDELEAFEKDDEAIFVQSNEGSIEVDQEGLTLIKQVRCNQEGSMLIKNLCVF